MDWIDRLIAAVEIEPAEETRPIADFPPYGVVISRDGK
jgi:hypothetical protein